MLERFWLWSDCKFVYEVWRCMPVRVWCLVHVRVITFDHDYIHIYGTWLERYRCTWLWDIGKNYRLDIVTGCKLIWQRKQSVWISKKVKHYPFEGVRRPQYRKFVYIRRLQYRQGTYIHEMQHIQVAYLLVYGWYMMTSSTIWLYTIGTGWLQVVGTYWYSFIVVYIIVTMWQWFHHLKLIF
jgi:hypothetical protein